MISICIPTVNGPHRLERCLSHIFKDDSIQRFGAEVLVLDDGSNQESLNRNKTICQSYDIRIIEHNGRFGVPTAWNNLVFHSGHDIVLLLNDDIEVTKHWLDVIIYTLNNNPLIGVVGLNSTEGERKEPPPVPHYIEAKLLFGSNNHPLLSTCGSAFAFRKSDYVSVGGFDQRYFCFYEEIDYCLSMLRMGKRLAMLTYPILHHYVAETTTTVLENPQQIMRESQEKFEQKWGIRWSDIRQMFNTSTIPQVPSIINEWNSAVLFRG